MRIGELAKRGETPVDTLRYYEKQGLIAEPPRSPAGYRDYPEVTLQYLNFIRSAKAVGFSLKECRDLLAIFVRRDAHTCAEVKQLSEAKLLELKDKMQALQAMHQTLKAISDACCGGEESAAHCSILDALQHKETIE
ncbi:MAG: Zn(2+)-responsive transcriptional regulator [Thiolinea sp.]